MKVESNDKYSSGNEKESSMNKGQKSSFKLTKEVYEKDFIPVYNLEECRPKTFIEFEVVLSFHIPMYTSRTVTLQSEQEYFSFRFDMVTTNESYKYLIGEELQILNVHKTKMLMMVAVELEYETILQDTERYYNDYFDLLLGNLNQIVLNYMIVKKDDDCHYLTKEMLPAVILVRSTNLETWENQKGLFMIHTHLPVEKELLSAKEVQEVMKMQLVVSWNLNPFLRGEQFVYTARRYFKQGFYLEAVNAIQTSVEVLIRTLFEELLRSEGKLDKEIEEQLEDTAFMAIIKKILSSYLGGSWDVTKDKTAVGKWYKNTYVLRNKATHSGRIPTFQEVDEAIYDALEFRKFIVERIKANYKKYPKLKEYII
ncbi:hypothetical protein [[Clostridium] fimetarium]|uniref:Apea-like HEPN domain-containing protein n=1 Tax=[Clostridium] fimetarium TaxID=99656 RepID=A0A1I0NG85_9FIRM|nr:hypothetical protein [[Clostridium] fimetarium]SEW00163.1 hypothetical protein SAMN05421659_10369 [[Clostridium] fimetarium]